MKVQQKMVPSETVFQIIGFRFWRVQKKIWENLRANSQTNVWVFDFLYNCQRERVHRYK